MKRAGWQFWIDRGGTFTDVVARSPDGRISCRKLLSEDAARYPDAAVYAIREILGDTPIDEVAAIKMGTTVATNALLERSGLPTLLVTTRGFADALRIGYQNRPDIFARQIVLPQMLYRSVVEAQERIGANGEILESLDETSLRQELLTAISSGIDSAAIVFMHAWRNPEHEQAAARLARECGFGQVTASHEVGQLIRLVGRGDTAVADAYLSPLIRRYVGQVGAALGLEPGDERLMFMQSNGGLTAANRFRGKDAILSGPAGGVVGMARTAARAGLDRVIGFDMGGTSTDVSLYQGEYERDLDSEVAGIRIRAPMLKIHTVAAGGGSILRFADGRLQAGPESAGADPGPACYRRGGPLTVTDANVILGRVRGEYFPAVFGNQGNQELDTEIVSEKFSRLAELVSRETGIPTDPLSVANGFLSVAIETMANAIKKISTRRGHDLARFALNCFGGAGGQHACRVADAIGIEQILIHPLGGVLSALGMGLADIRAIRQRTIDRPLSEDALLRIQPVTEILCCEVAAELHDQGIDVARQLTRVRLLLRYAGTETALAQPIAAASTLRDSFESAHCRVFGFATPDREIVIDAVEVEGLGRTGTGEIGARPEGPAVGPVAHHPVTMADGRLDTPFFTREDLSAGQCIAGPAVITEATGTTVVEPGWNATVVYHGELLLERVRRRQQTRAAGTTVDPVRLEVFNNLFMHIAEQMGVALERTAQSVNIRERLDFSCAVFDAGGNLVANAPHMPVHLGSMGDSVRAVTRAHGDSLVPGDSYAINSPYAGGTHLPDITVVTPVFDGSGEQVLGFVAARGHHADVGGMTPGSMPPGSRHIDEEGVLFDSLLVVRNGRLRENAIRQQLSATRWPARNPEQNLADLKAQVAANERGIAELRNAMNHYGEKTVLAYMGHVQDNAEESVRRAIGALNDGQFAYALDNGLVIKVSISIDRENRSASVDFSGTSPQSDGNFNAPLPVCRAAVLYVFRTLVDEPIPMNEGCLRPISLHVPAGSLLDPVWPAAVVAGNVETSQCIVDTLYGALGVMAAAQGTMNNLTFGNEQHQYYETICGGSGAGPDFDGASAVHSHMTNSRLTDPEILESRYPVRVMRFAIRRGSGGKGASHGGDGVVREIAFLEPATVSILSNHRTVAPFGLQGGAPGLTGANALRRSDGSIVSLGATGTATVEPGDAVVIETPGGGGYGKPR